jgi:hypothetical protein
MEPWETDRFEVYILPLLLNFVVEAIACAQIQENDIKDRHMINKHNFSFTSDNHLCRNPKECTKKATRMDISEFNKFIGY